MRRSEDVAGLLRLDAVIFLPSSVVSEREQRLCKAQAAIQVRDLWLRPFHYEETHPRPAAPCVHIKVQVPQKLPEGRPCRGGGPPRKGCRRPARTYPSRRDYCIGKEFVLQEISEERGWKPPRLPSGAGSQLTLGEARVSEHDRAEAVPYCPVLLRSGRRRPCALRLPWGLHAKHHMTGV